MSVHPSLQLITFSYCKTITLLSYVYSYFAQDREVLLLAVGVVEAELLRIELFESNDVLGRMLSLVVGLVAKP